MGLTNSRGGIAPRVVERGATFVPDRLRVLCTLTCLLVASCAARTDPHAAGAGGGGPTETAPEAERMEPFTQTIPGSDGARTAMRPVTVDPSAEIRPFWIGETELTWDAYDPFLLRLDLPEDQRMSPEADPGPDAVTRPTQPYSPADRGWGHKGFPALGVTFHAAQQYCRWLSEKTGSRYRLPTVTEWQLACRSADKGPSRPADPEKVAWFEANADDRAHAVAKKEPNALGLYDTLGNVAEWCTDADGKPVACGGSFRTGAADLSCDLQERQTRQWNASDPSFPRSKWWLADGPFVGFRVVCEGRGAEPGTGQIGAPTR